MGGGTDEGDEIRKRPRDADVHRFVGVTVNEQNGRKIGADEIERRGIGKIRIAFHHGRHNRIGIPFEGVIRLLRGDVIHSAMP